VSFRVRDTEGGYRWFLSRAEPLRAGDGTLLYWVGVNLDIEERELAEERLAASNEELRTALKEIEEVQAYLADAQRLTHTGSFVWDTKTREALHLSDEWSRIFEFDAEKGRRAWKERLERVHPEDRIKWQAAIDRAINDKSDYDMEYRILLPSGMTKYLHVVGHPVLNSSGDVVQFMGSVMDITTAKQVEEKIRQQEMELRQILDLTPQHLFVFGSDGSPLYANRAAREYFGVDIDPLLAESRIDFLHPDDRERVLAQKKKGILEGVAHEFEARLLRRDGRFRWFLFRRNPLKDEQGHITRWYSTATDIEDRKQAEERLQHENIALREEIDKTSMFEEIVGASPALQAVLADVAKVAPTESTVLTTGETGTGKELIARAIHKRSPRSSGPFVSVNCAAIPQNLIASELFGHEKGAFTGALQRRTGRFELADGGTIFLHEIGELPAETQIALLRVLQEREFERVGGNQAIRADVRVIAATNRDLHAAIASGAFRNDLFYWLNVFPIEIPPLRERREDIPMLVEYFIGRYASKAGKNIRGLRRRLWICCSRTPGRVIFGSSRM
jgi:formate hydrogenlyase transcriptional activator